MGLVAVVCRPSQRYVKSGSIRIHFPPSTINRGLAGSRYSLNPARPNFTACSHCDLIIQNLIPRVRSQRRVRLITPPCSRQTLAARLPADRHFSSIWIVTASATALLSELRFLILVSIQYNSVRQFPIPSW